MSSNKFWRTKSGILVKQEGKEIDGKIHCYRYPEGGYHGWLWKRNLITAKAGAPANKRGKSPRKPVEKPAKKSKARTMAELSKSVDYAMDLVAKERAQVAMLLEQTRLLREEIRIAKDSDVYALLSDLRRVINQGAVREYAERIWSTHTVSELMSRISNLIGP